MNIGIVTSGKITYYVDVGNDLMKDLFSFDTSGNVRVFKADYTPDDARTLAKALVGAVGLVIGILSFMGDAGELDHQKVFLDTDKGYRAYQTAIRAEVAADTDEYSEDMSDEDAENYYDDLLSNADIPQRIRWEIQSLDFKVDQEVSDES